jgi:hypothetical protein
VGVTLHRSKVYANILTVWEKADFDIDVAQGKNLADASKESWCPAPHLVFVTECHFKYVRVAVGLILRMHQD